ncbi:MAG: hypothetical protein Q9226_000450 [Calogaya cf. arnoldii]
MDQADKADNILPRSPKQLAQERILGGSPMHTLEAFQSLRSMFKDFNATEDMDLPILHQIVLGLTPSNLEDELRKPITQINAQDLLGYTALNVGYATPTSGRSWMCRRYIANGEHTQAHTPLARAAIWKDKGRHGSLSDRSTVRNVSNIDKRGDTVVFN